MRKHVCVLCRHIILLVYSIPFCSTEVSLPTNCTSIVFEGVFSNLPREHLKLLGMVYNQSTQTHDGKPIFELQVGQDKLYLFYLTNCTAWVIKNQTVGGGIYFFAHSVLHHPASVKTGWWDIIGETPKLIGLAGATCTRGIIQESNCSAITFGEQFPGYHQVLLDLVVFEEVKSRDNGKPLFEFYVGNNSIRVFYNFTAEAWTIKFDDTGNVYEAFSKANHPVDVKATWWHSSVNNTFFRAVPNVFLECRKDHHPALADSCDIIEFIHTPFDGQLSVYMTRIDVVHNDRPVYVTEMNTNVTLYLYYHAKHSTWIVAHGFPTPKLTAALVFSTVKHPESIKGIWYITLTRNETIVRQSFKEAYLRCKTDPEAKCKAVKISGIENMHLAGVSDKLYRQINLTSHGRPVYYVGSADGMKGSYIYYTFDDVDRFGYWCVGNNISDHATLRTKSDNAHPVDAKNPWRLYDKGTVTDIFADVHVDCAVENEALKQLKPSELTTAVTLAVSSGILLMCSAVIAGLWYNRRHYRKGIRYRYTGMKDAQYDVYICYKSGSAGQNFVRETLRPVIERDWGFTVATDVPSFIPGHVTDENEKAMERLGRSRRIILILTFDFLECLWCNRKLSSAITQVEEGRAKIVPIFLDDITSSEELSKLFRHMMKISKGIPTPDNWNNRKARQFWKLLRKALPNEKIPRENESREEDQFLDSEPQFLSGDHVDRMKMLLLETSNKPVQSRTDAEEEDTAV